MTLTTKNMTLPVLADQSIILSDRFFFPLTKVYRTKIYYMRRPLENSNEVVGKDTDLMSLTDKPHQIHVVSL